MVSVCLTCGDEGIRNALIYCENCKICAIHRYCLFVLPKNLTGPVVWFCEDCELDKDVKFSSVGQCGLESLKPVQERNESVVSCFEMKEDNGCLLSKEDGPSLEKCSSRQSFSACCSANNFKEDEPFAKQADLDGDFSADTAESLDKKKNGNKDQKDGKKNGVSNDNCDEESEFRKAKDCQSIVLYASSATNQICHVSQPMQEPIWRGSLNISNKKFATFDGLVVHLSTLACARVHEHARMLPGLLSPDMLSRAAVWPKAFELSPPSYDSIGFYIFPDNKRSEKEFGNLMLEMIHQDLALRAVVQNAEILIFTSTLLPMDYWRFQEKMYLWGVFKKLKTPCVALDRVSEENKGLRKAIIVNAQSPVSTLINSSDGMSLMNSPSG